jgi:RNA polymerase sigma-54 factor
VQSDFDWENYVQNYTYPIFSQPYLKEEDLITYETPQVKRKSLAEHLMWQLNLSISSEFEKDIGELIIGNLNDDGYLLSTLEEIAQKATCEIAVVERVLLKIQEFDPIGVAARDLKECLLIQAKNLSNADLLKTIISNHLHELQIKNYKAIQKSLIIPIQKVIEIARQISNLEPKPGRIFYDQDAQYVSPDIFVYRYKDDFIIAINEDGLPKLKISSFYKNILKKEVLASNTKTYIMEKLKSAMWLIRGIHQRQRTIYKVVESIIKFQKEFLMNGVTFLKPMRLRDIANDIEMHESTISRVTSNKYIHTPQGVLPLKYFFSADLSDGSNEMAQESLKDRIKKIISKENTLKPYSYKEITEFLKKNNVFLSRRTIAKYRESLGYLPACKRKKLQD